MLTCDPPQDLLSSWLVSSNCSFNFYNYNLHKKSTQAKDLRNQCSIIQSLYSMDQHSIEIYECKHNITNIGKRYTLCIDMEGRDFTTKSGN